MSSTNSVNRPSYSITFRIRSAISTHARAAPTDPPQTGVIAAIAARTSDEDGRSGPSPNHSLGLHPTAYASASSLAGSGREIRPVASFLTQDFSMPAVRAISA